ncbi:hypothetical protein GGS23DRAFT_572592 [Durotheca rogersii]|uniref:uncharacterized protein n=1 Tax=Durotheca rogersii TaxID=419775 RepID=UPI0022203616|nr:uncharacterized protein GGS23DRAFT_572592 [Durotheca rogersii]KAI5862084.1 hypothetical protein GGS23DRAFT_572592 [Durotheca rogersii]
MRSSSASNNRGVRGGDDRYQYSVRGGPAPPRPPRDFDSSVSDDYMSGRHQNRQSLQPAPPVQAPHSYRNSIYGRPASSIYSQPSPAAATFAAHQLRAEAAYRDPTEISPPSSPDILSPRDGPNPGDVSPIDEIPDMSQLAMESEGLPKPEARTNIPMMRRERRKNSDAALSALRESKSRERLKQQRPHGHDIRWDPRTGEPTTDVKGHPSQVNPQEYAHGLGIQTDPASPPRNKQDQQSQSPFGERVRRARQPGSTSTGESSLGQRPEWKGASGRTTLVAPVSDTKDVPKLKVPRKSSKRAAREQNVLPPVASVGSEPTSSPAARIPGVGGNRRTTAQSSGVAVVPQTYPSPPLSDDNSTTPANSHTTTHPREHHQTPAGDKAIRRKPAGGSSGHYHEPPASSETPSQYNHTPRAAQTAPVHMPGTSPEDGWTQPPSRFSITTYATSQQSSTPRESVDGGNEPPVPPLPLQPVRPSILDRKRPVVSGYEDNDGSFRKNSPPVEAVKISLDSPYYTAVKTVGDKDKNNRKGGNKNGTTSRDVDSSGSRDSNGTAVGTGTEKSLPLAPPETESQDRVAQLDARLRALGNRRINLNTAIRQMTELMPTDGALLETAATARRREEEKRKVETLRQELAEVERESYDLGLKLHRAYKRLDRNAEFEPTTLWVRRVTG